MVAQKQGALTNEGIFTDICYDRTKPEDFQRFIAEGFLSPLVARATETKLDTSEVGMNAGEYNLKQLEAAVDKNDVTHAALRELCMAAEGRRAWMIFATGISHAEHCAETLNNWGIRTGVVHSKMGAANRDQVLRDWFAGRLRCVTNNNVLTTGIDYPAIDLIGMLRPTLSSSLWVQMLGRGMRVTQGKTNCLVLDFAGNTARLGPVDDPEIPGRPKPKLGPGDAPVKICPTCNTYNHTSARFCSYCAHEFPRTSDPISGHSSDKPLMSIDTLPVIETFRVDSVSYNDHYSKAENRSIRVTYHCGIRQFSEYVSIGGNGLALHKAKNWWMTRSHTDPPASIEEALDQVSQLRTPTRIRVWVNAKFPEITEIMWH